MRRPSPALVVAVIALVFAMGGTGWAVTQLPKNSVGTQQLKKSSVTSAKIKDGTIATADLAAATQTALRGQTGATGAPGATGAQGPPGPSVGAAAMNGSGGSIGTAYADVVALGSTASATSSGPVTVTQASRLQFTATAQVFKSTSDAGSRGYVTCKVQYSRVVPAGTLTTVRDTDTANNAAAFLASSATSDAVTATLAVTGYQDVSAGSYDVRLSCTRSASPYVTVNVTVAGITVVAIPA